jgi:Ca2+-binding RTX toxin-like protein
MNKIKQFFTVLLASVLFLSTAAMPAGAVAPWNVTGNYEITFLLDGDATPYIHHATLNQSGTSVTGDGGFPATGGDTHHWNITSGTQTADSINLTAVYDLGASGTIMNMIGTIAANGTVTGTWTDDFGGARSGTWSITDGISVPKIHTPAHGSTVTQSALVKVDWTDAVGANPPFEYQYEAYSDAGYTTLIYSTAPGWLSSSEILTPGTPPGEYYLRVRAKNAAGDISNWSNGTSNPYHITVVANPINAFPVPAQCDQTIAYNKIEGTDASEKIIGTPGSDLILAKGGSDKVEGRGGNDCIVGGDGSDKLLGEDGNDVILGEDGADKLEGGAGADKLYGGNGSDKLLGNGDADVLRGEEGADSLEGGTGADTLLGGEGSDSLKGDAGDDTLDGQEGMDSAKGGIGTDTCTAESKQQCEA